MASILPYITGSGGALVVLVIACYLFFVGKLHSDKEFSKLEMENKYLKDALDDERRALNEAAQTGSVTNQLISALAEIATQKIDGHDRRVDSKKDGGTAEMQQGGER